MILRFGCLLLEYPFTYLPYAHALVAQEEALLGPFPRLCGLRGQVGWYLFYY